MPLCKMCNMPSFYGVYGYDRINYYCADCTKRERLKNKFKSVFCRDEYPNEGNKHHICNPDDINYKWCHCNCHIIV